MLSSKRRLRCVAVLFMLMAMSACGRASEAEKLAASPAGLDWGALVDGAPISSLRSSFIAADDSLAVIIDGGVSTTRDGRGSLRYWSVDTGPDEEEIEMPDSIRRAMIVAWMAGDGVAVLSTPCPKWTVETARPSFDEERPDWLQEGCGDSSFDLWVWGRSTHQWDQVSDDLFSAPGGFSISGPRGSKAIISIPSVERSEEDEGRPNETFYVIDGAEGSIRTLPGLPDDPEIVHVEMCLLQDDQVILGANTLPGEGAIRVVPAPEEEVYSTPRVKVFLLEDREWRRLSVDYSAISVGGCDPSNGLVLKGQDDVGLVRSVKDEAAGVEKLMLPEARTYIRDGFGGIVAIRLDGHPPDEAAPSALHLLRDGEWKELKGVDDASEFAYIVDDVPIGIAEDGHDPKIMRVEVTGHAGLGAP